MVTTSLDVCHGFVGDNRNAIVHSPNQLFHGKLPLTVDEGPLDVVHDEGGHDVDGGVNLFLHGDQLLDFRAPLTTFGASCLSWSGRAPGTRTAT